MERETRAHAPDTSGHPDVVEAVEGELRLLDPAVRSSRPLAAELLDPEFTEVGASGRRWTYEEILAALPDMAGDPGDGTHHRPSAVTGTLLAPGVVHLTFETVRDGRRARRSSVWRRASPADGGRMRMYYHQGTPVPGEEAQP
ncbi:DUF4440 domain-containing protein [Streptomyces sp. NPDC056528]|uniref:nuclear transport factor 2 family protein n=1 Tax=Streptomyces sp. NPDC056528 TaxID=3345854 RepID=UPI0036B45469